MTHCMVQEKGKIICAIGDLFSSKEKKSKIGKCSSQEEKETRLPKDRWFQTSPHWMLYMLGHVPEPHWRNLKSNAGSLNTRFDGSSWMQDMWSMQCWMKMTAKKKKNSPIPQGSVCMEVAGSMGVTRKKYSLTGSAWVLVRRAKKSQHLQCDYNVRASLQCFTCVKGTMGRQWN